jgi:hypothetical protein
MNTRAHRSIFKLSQQSQQFLNCGAGYISYTTLKHAIQSRMHIPIERSRSSFAKQLRNGHPFQIYQLVHRREQEKNLQWNNMISTLERHFSIRSPEQNWYATRQGLLGLTAGDVQQDEVVALLPGSAVSILLRAVDLSKRTFRVVEQSHRPNSSELEWNNLEMPYEAFDNVILV